MVRTQKRLSLDESLTLARRVQDWKYSLRFNGIEGTYGRLAFAMGYDCGGGRFILTHPFIRSTKYAVVVADHQYKRWSREGKDIRAVYESSKTRADINREEIVNSAIAEARAHLER
ncbi:MAG: hypothetical protein KKB31_07010 [Nanoarchaeota archaeon]|nr:hypothetical protein [Nanoarchaeota archaeon]